MWERQCESLCSSDRQENRHLRLFLFVSIKLTKTKNPDFWGVLSDKKKFNIMKRFIFSLLALMAVTLVSLTLTACGDDGDGGGSGSGGSGGSSSNTGTFQGAKRVFGNNLVKAFGQEGYDRYEFTYDSKGFVTRVHRTRYETSSSNTEYDLYITYNENVVINTYKDGALQGTSTINIGSNGFASSFTYGNEVNTLSYNSDNQLTAITYSHNNKTEVNSYTYSGGNITQSAWDGEVESNIAYTSPTQSAITNIAGVMEYDNAMGIDMDDYQLAYYFGLAGFGTKNLPLAYTDSHSTTKNTWTLDAIGRATKVVVEKTSYGSTSTKTFFWEY